jgi:hypothetical protein
MKVAVGLVTCERPDLLKRTLASLRGGGFELCIVDNSPRGTWPSRGFAEAASQAYETGADIIVLSPDDMEYRPGWLDSLRSFWNNAPRAVGLLGHCLLPVFPYSVPYGGIEIGGVRALLRPVTIAAWSFRREDYELTRIDVAPKLWEKRVCWRVRDAGRLIAEADLAEHIGEQQSSMGHNRTWAAAAPVAPYVERWMR